MKLVFFVLACCSVVVAQPAKSPPNAAPPAKPAKAALPAPAPTKPQEARANAPAVPAKVDPAATTEPKAKSETLRFTVNWPSGLSLGEGQMTSSFEAGRWNFSYRVEAAIPAFAIVEGAKSQATEPLCSLELLKNSTRGKRKTEEKTTFDSEKLTAKRQTIVKDGGVSEIKITSCAKDALTFVHFLRRELAAGRLPAAQPVYYGAGYQTRVQYVGTQNIRAGAAMVETDKLLAHIKGPASEFSVELFFARDAARTPVLFQIPLAMAKFTVEFER